MNVLEVSKLRTHFALDEGVLKAVDGVDLKIAERTTTGVIGESGRKSKVRLDAIKGNVPIPNRSTGPMRLLYPLSRSDGGQM